MFRLKTDSGRFFLHLSIHFSRTDESAPAFEISSKMVEIYCVVKSPRQTANETNSLDI